MSKIKKVLPLLLLSTLSFSIIAGEKKERIVTKTRVLNSIIQDIGSCEEVDVSSHDTQLIRRSRDNQIYTVNGISVSASTKVATQECITYENYQVKIVGSGWNAEETELPNTTVRYKKLENKDKRFSETNEIALDDDQVIPGLGSSQASLAIKLSQSARIVVENQCEQFVRKSSQRMTANKSCE